MYARDEKEIISIPRPTLQRLPVYLRMLERYIPDGLRVISSSELGRRAGIDEYQVRKDLSAFYGGGRPGLGYDEVFVRQEDLACGLATLAHHLAKKSRARKGKPVETDDASGVVPTAGANEGYVFQAEKLE